MWQMLGNDSPEIISRIFNIFSALIFQLAIFKVPSHFSRYEHPQIKRLTLAPRPELTIFSFRVFITHIRGFFFTMNTSFSSEKKSYDLNHINCPMYFHLVHATCFLMLTDLYVFFLQHICDIHYETNIFSQ